MFILESIGLALPERVVSQTEAAAIGAACSGGDERGRRVVEQLYHRTTVRHRSTVVGLPVGGEGEAVPLTFDPPTAAAPGGPTTAARLRAYEHHAPPLAARAASAALKAAGVAAGEVTQLIAVTCTGFAAPGWDVELIERLGLDRGVGRTAVGFMGCHGAMNGLRVASALADQQPGTRVLMVAAELCTLHFQYGYDPQQIVANALFGDGAAAVVGHATPHGAPPHDGGDVRWGLIGSGSHVLPDTRGEMTWRIGDHGFVMSLSARVPELVKAEVGPWVRGWLDGLGLEVGDIDGWAIHPGGPRVISAVQAALGLDPHAGDTSRAVLAEHGNMSSPTVLFILDRLGRRGCRRCVGIAFGPGLTVEAAVFERGGATRV